MNKTSIIIIVICTAIIAAVVFFTLKEEAGIEDIYLIHSDNIEEGPIEDKGDREFSSTESTIYIIIPVKGVRAGDQVKAVWIFMAEDGNKIIQRDNIEVEDEGSGTIAAYFIKTDSSYKPGKYKVRVEYNDLMEKEVSFSITES
jgi:hypothetical protein